MAACNKEDDGNTPSGSEDKLVSLIGRDAEAYQQRMEVPAVKDQSMFIVHSTAKYGVTYTLEWDKVLKMQRWAAYSITDLNAVANWNRKNWEGATWQGVTYNGDPFQEDPILPAQYRTHLSDYRSSGFTRGHIVNSQDRGAPSGIQQNQTQGTVHCQGRYIHPHGKHPQSAEAGRRIRGQNKSQGTALFLDGYSATGQQQSVSFHCLLGRAQGECCHGYQELHHQH